MNYIDLINNIDEKKLNNIVLIQIKEPYLYDLAMESIKKDYLNEAFLDLNYVKLDFEKLTGQRFLDSVETLPFMDEHKIVLIENVVLNKDKLKKYEATFDYIQKYLENPNQNTILILSHEADSLFKGKFVKAVEKAGSFYEISRLDKRQFNGFIVKHFAKSKIKIDSRNAAFINDRLGYNDRDSKQNLFEVVNELDKLLNNINSKEPTTAEIEEAVTEQFDDNIFMLTDSLSDRNVQKALEIYKRLKEEEDPFRIFHMILRQIRNILCVKDCVDKRVNKQTGMSYCSIGSFEYDKGVRFARNFTVDELIAIHSQAYETELKSKTGGPDMEYLVKRLILEFARRD